tara:strand:+ start:322 stop:510 length:189 start_codon:yes stop_codon:yes gene_type:complete
MKKKYKILIEGSNDVIIVYGVRHAFDNENRLLIYDNIGNLSGCFNYFIGFTVSEKKDTAEDK